MQVARFVGDPRGYVLVEEVDPSAMSYTSWVEARVGRTDEIVLVNLTMSYLIEHGE